MTERIAHTAAWTRFWAYLAALASISTLIWLGILVFGDTPGGFDCHYLVPVKGHPGVLACSQTPAPVRAKTP